MKKTNTFTNIAMFVLFAAMLVYLGVYLFRSTQQSYATAPAVLVTVSESGQASGIVVREEQVIASDKEFLSLSVDDGKEVASGGEIAIGVDSKAALDSASRARELKKEIAYVSSLLSRAGSASGASDRDSDVRSAILQLNAAVSAGSTSELDDLCMDLSSLLFGSATGTVSATVMSKSEPDGSGKVAVVFACNAALSDTLAMRKTTADVVYSEHTGLRVPLKAVHMDDDGQAFVYVVTAAQLEKKPIEIIYQTDDYCLVAQSTESNALRAGNEIVVTGKGLSNGQVVK